MHTGCSRSGSEARCRVGYLPFLSVTCLSCRLPAFPALVTCLSCWLPAFPVKANKDECPSFLRASSTHLQLPFFQTFCFFNTVSVTVFAFVFCCSLHTRGTPALIAPLLLSSSDCPVPSLPSGSGRRLQLQELQPCETC